MNRKVKLSPRQRTIPLYFSSPSLLHHISLFVLLVKDSIENFFESFFSFVHRKCNFNEHLFRVRKSHVKRAQAKNKKPGNVLLLSKMSFDGIFPSCSQQVSNVWGFFPRRMCLSLHGGYKLIRATPATP